MRFSRKSITWSALPTFLDAGILIAAVRGQAKEAARALAILEDPERSFLTSDFLRMEVLPKAIYYQRPAEVAKAGGAEEFITTENPTQPLFRVTGIVITPLI